MYLQFIDDLLVGFISRDYEVQQSKPFKNMFCIFREFCLFLNTKLLALKKTPILKS